MEQRVIELEKASLKRKPAEEALRESEEKLRTFKDTAADFVAVTDKNENLIYVNRSMAEALGYAKEEIIGKHIDEIMSEESMANFESELKKFVEKGRLSIEVTWLRRNGEKVHRELNVNAMFDRDGSYSGSRGVFRDMTEGKRAERELAESEERLRTLFELAQDGYY